MRQAGGRLNARVEICPLTDGVYWVRYGVPTTLLINATWWECLGPDERQLVLAGGLPDDAQHWGWRKRGGDGTLEGESAAGGGLLGGY